MDAVLSCMVTDSLGPGTLADELVSQAASYLEAAGGIALRERVRALGVALDLLRLAPGTGVVLDCLVPHGYHRVVTDRGLIPIYVDVDERSLCINPRQVANAVARGKAAPGGASVPGSDVAEGEEVASVDRAPGPVPVGAIITRATLGFIPDMEALAGLGIPIVEDVSEGIGGNTGERRVGSFGRFVVVGMEPDGVVTAGGGTVLLASGKGDRNALRHHARLMTTDALLQDMNAALGITQIKEIEKFIARRAEIASVYSRAIMRGRHGTPVQPGEAQNVHLVFPVLVEGSVNEVVTYARKKGVECRPAFEGSVLERYGRPAHAGAGDGADPEGAADDTASLDEHDFPVARALLLRCLQFPLYPSLTAKEVATVERVLSTLP